MSLNSLCTPSATLTSFYWNFIVIHVQYILDIYIDLDIYFNVAHSLADRFLSCLLLSSIYF